MASPIIEYEEFENLIEHEEFENQGHVVRLGGTASMDILFKDLWMTRCPDPEEYVKDEKGEYVKDEKGEYQPVYTPENLAKRNALFAAVEQEMALRDVATCPPPLAGDEWEEYTARLLPLHERNIPACFRLPSRVPDPEAAVMIWGHTGYSTSRGHLYAWVPDVFAARRRREKRHRKCVAEADRELLRAHPREVRSFQRAMRRLESHVRRHAPHLRGIVHDIECARRHVGTSLGRHDRAGLKESAQWFVGVAYAERYRSKNDKWHYKDSKRTTRVVAFVFERAAEHIEKLVSVTGGGSQIPYPGLEVKPQIERTKEARAT